MGEHTKEDRERAVGSVCARNQWWARSPRLKHYIETGEWLNDDNDSEIDAETDHVRARRELTESLANLEARQEERFLPLFTAALDVANVLEQEGLLPDCQQRLRAALKGITDG